MRTYFGSTNSVAKSNLAGWAWCVFSLVANAFGLLSFVFRLFPSDSPLGEFFLGYHDLLSGAGAGTVTPMVQPVFDYLLLASGMFASANFFSLRTDRTTVFGRLRLRYRGRAVLAYSGAAAIYIAGPIIWPVALMKTLVTGRAWVRVFPLSFQPRPVLTYYSAMLAIILVAVVIGR